MKINVVFIPVEKSRLSSKDKAEISMVVKRHTLRAVKLLRIKRKTLSFTIHPFWRGWGASAESKEWVKLKCPFRWQSAPKRDFFLNKRLPESVYHELHHIARKYVYSLEKSQKYPSLIEALISEGLATAFSEEMIPSHKVDYGLYKERVIKKWLKLVQREKASRKYNHEWWFFGRGDKPLWLGYKMGKYIIDQLKKRHPKLTAVKLAKIDAKKILKLSGVKI